MNLLFDNPLLTKHVRSRLRRQQITTPIAIVVILAMLAMYAGFALGGLEEGVIFSILFVIQGIILVLAGSNQIGSTVNAARQTEILDFHRVSPLSPVTIAFGFLVGAPIREYLLVAVLVPFCFMCACLGPPGPLNYLILLALLVSSASLFHCIAMISGLLNNKVRKGNPAVALVVLSHVFGGQIVAGVALPATLTVLPAFVELMAEAFAGPGVAQQAVPKFFGVVAPIWMQSFAYQIPFTLFLFTACVRRMHSAEAPLFSKPQACSFLITLAVLVIAGLIDPPARQVAGLARTGTVYTLLFAGFALVSCVTPESGYIANGIRRADRLGDRGVSFWDDASHNGLIAFLLGLILFAGGEAAIALLPAARGQVQAKNVHFPPIIAMLTLIYYGWGLQLFQLKYHRRARTYYTLLLFVLWGVPLVLAAILAARFQGADFAGKLASISPFAAIATGNIFGLIATIIPTLVFGVLLRESVHRFERKIQEGDASEDPVILV